MEWNGNGIKFLVSKRKCKQTLREKINIVYGGMPIYIYLYPFCVYYDETFCLSFPYSTAPDKYVFPPNCNSPDVILNLLDISFFSVPKIVTIENEREKGERKKFI